MVFPQLNCSSDIYCSASSQILCRPPLLLISFEFLVIGPTKHLFELLLAFICCCRIEMAWLNDGSSSDPYNLDAPLIWIVWVCALASCVPSVFLPKHTHGGTSRGRRPTSTEEPKMSDKPESSILDQTIALRKELWGMQDQNIGGSNCDTNYRADQTKRRAMSSVVQVASKKMR